MRILAIETSCDETGLAIVEAKGGLKNPRFKVLKNIVSSQIAIHRPFGGVVPNLAKREHIKNLPKLWNELKKQKPKFDLIGVTVGPGLEPALWAGIEFAKKLSEETGKTLLGGNHMEAHLYSNWLTGKKFPGFPAIGLVVSGGHTILLKMNSLAKWKKLGETRDDAAGEAFDKVARLLELPYPGGPEVEKLAKRGNPKAVEFPRPMLKDKNYEFSFSGLKTSVLYFHRDNPKVSREDLCASFQQSVIDVLVGKTIRAAREFGAQSILLSGGVAANKTLRGALADAAKKERMEFFVPPFEYNTDNAAMIASAVYLAQLRKKKYPLRANSNLGL
ncbi:MAG: tRNA N6-adenosine threonylcarbamoyltransferase [Parcubacteria group bacterium Gr01-1014_19]|nr:MAG: tRNA N6-adenosine threonylcarbamoyltransferase [Parcubacteria group bacterium Gr01-1014_19]